MPRPAAPRLALALALLSILGPAAARAQALAGGATWRGARWGTSLEQLLTSFPEAKRLEKPLKLADGNTVAAGVEKVELGGVAFQQRFVFDAAGGLALVSFRTPVGTYAGDDQMKKVESALVATLGPPSDRSEDKEFDITQRQVTWKFRDGRVDLKTLPGVVVVLHAAPTQKPPEAQPSPAAGPLTDTKNASPLIKQ